MTTHKRVSATPENFLGSLLAEVRLRGGLTDSEGLSIRALAKRADVSAAQISRIESGQVAKPGPEVLTAIARALEQNPLPLLIIAGHISGERAAQEMRSMFFRDGSELLDVWEDRARYSLKETLDRIHDPATPEAELRLIAADIFRAEETDETLWDPAYSMAMARGEQAAELRELMSLWRITSTKREQILDYMRLQGRIADLESVAELQEIEAASAVADGEEDR